MEPVAGFDASLIALVRYMLPEIIASGHRHLGRVQADAAEAAGWRMEPVVGFCLLLTAGLLSVARDYRQWSMPFRKFPGRRCRVQPGREWSLVAGILLLTIDRWPVICCQRLLSPVVNAIEGFQAAAECSLGRERSVWLNGFAD
jgi:hypothetical protein